MYTTNNNNVQRREAGRGESNISSISERKKKKKKKGKEKTREKEERKMRNASSASAPPSSSSKTPCCIKVGLKRGPWTPEEDEVLANYIKKEGEGRWRTLPKRAGLLRCGKSCRLRWMNYLRPSVKRGQIAPDEEDLILRLHRLLGNRLGFVYWLQSCNLHSDLFEFKCSLDFNWGSGFRVLLIYSYILSFFCSRV